MAERRSCLVDNKRCPTRLLPSRASSRASTSSKDLSERVMEGGRRTCCSFERSMPSPRIRPEESFLRPHDLLLLLPSSSHFLSSFFTKTTRLTCSFACPPPPISSLSPATSSPTSLQSFTSQSGVPQPHKPARQSQSSYRSLLGTTRQRWSMGWSYGGRE